MGKTLSGLIFTLLLFVFISFTANASGETPRTEPEGEEEVLWMVYFESLNRDSKILKDVSFGMEFVFIRGGCFQMGDIFGDGDSDEKPVHAVCVKDFYIGKYEVTQGQWKTIMGNNPSDFKDCGDNCPVEGVSWNEIREFIRKPNQRPGAVKYRLPTEAEWEYAAKSGGKKEKYAGTNNEPDIESYAWYINNSSLKTHPVGQKKPNGIGLYDMSGNVWEWVQDKHDEEYYKDSPKNNPKGPHTGDYRVFRGGSWDNSTKYIRVTNRNAADPTTRNSYIGFRLVFSAQ